MTNEQIEDVRKIAERWHNREKTPGIGQAYFDIGYLVGLLIQVYPQLRLKGGGNGMD